MREDSQAPLIFRAELWFPLGLLTLTALGAVVLAQAPFVTPEARGAEVFWARHFWQVAFDALSAASGCGILTYDFERHYTPSGRGVLTALGIAGAALYLIAFAQAIRAQEDPRLRFKAGLAAFVIVSVLLALIGAGIDAASGKSAWVWNLPASFASLGWRVGEMSGTQSAVIAAIAWVGGAGIVFALLVAGRLRAKLLSAYAIWVVLAGGLICLLETPRGGDPQSREEASLVALGEAKTSQRLARGVTLAASVSGAGIPSETIADRGVRDGTKIVLGLLLLVGGLPGAAAGGMTLWLTIVTIRSAFVSPAARRRPGAMPGLRRAAARLTILIGGMTLLTTFGLLALEALTASRFQLQPTFADAFVDACSAVGGGGLSAGVIESVTSRNLISGIRLGMNQYQYGMVWVMFAMFAGRWLPVLVLSRTLSPPKQDSIP